MRKFYCLLLTFFLLAACKNGYKNQSGAELSAAVLNKLLGSFVGQFGDNKITLLITKAEAGIIEGRTIVGGNDRPFAGSVTEEDGIFSVTAKEPGDDTNDGEFAFKIESSNPDVVSGSWKPFDKNKGAKDYTLHRKAFVYNTEVGFFPQASQRELEPEDVENMIKPDLEQMRNEIFARHGYCFKRKAMRETFEEEDWYVPNSTDIRNQLTAIEKKNIALIKRYEKYAEDHGDDYGR
jgi:YARHG domain